jgi:hypothetical protein
MSTEHSQKNINNFGKFLTPSPQENGSFTNLLDHTVANLPTPLPQWRSLDDPKTIVVGIELS